MAIGVSGCGKTRLHFDIARQRLAIYIECVGRRVQQHDVTLFATEVAGDASPQEKTNSARRLFQLVVLSRIITLLLFADNLGGRLGSQSTAFAAAWDLPANFLERWLHAQLDGACTISTLIYIALQRHVSTAGGVECLTSFVTSHLVRLETTVGSKLVFLMDEAHEWHKDPTFASCESSDRIQRTLLNVSMATLSLSSVQRSSLWSGTALSLCDLRNLQSSMATSSDAASDYAMEQLEFGFTPLSPSNVTTLLTHFLSTSKRGRTWDLSDASLAAFAQSLQGRPRLASTFLATLIRAALGRSAASEHLWENIAMAVHSTYMAVQRVEAVDQWSRLISGFSPLDRGRVARDYRICGLRGTNRGSARGTNRGSSHAFILFPTAGTSGRCK